MPIGIDEEHEALHESVKGWAARHIPPSVPRSLLDAEREEPPGYWSDLAAQGWLGLHLDETHGGSGYGLTELAVVIEELARAGSTGPFLASVLAAAVVEAGGKEAAAELLPGVAVGELVGAVALEGALDATAEGDGVRVGGTLRPVLSGHLATLLVARAGDGWCVLTEGEFTARELKSVDPTRRVAEVTVPAGTVVPAARLLPDVSTDQVEALAALLFSADAVGGSQWCVETSAEYVKVREQFGRPIGQFQGVKHRCANMLARTELARAAVWDATRAIGEGESGSLTVATAAALAVDAYLECAKDNVQNHGGIGFTWEHDAHVFLRRAMVTRQLIGTPGIWRVRAARLAIGGARRRLTVDLPPEAEAMREEVSATIAEVEPLDPAERNARLAESGYVQPQWPAPWGRDAGAVEQLVIEDEFRKAKLERPRITIGAWACPPVIVYGTREQQERWIPPTLRGEIRWCQLFSEPGAGSDLASLQTRAVRDGSGYIVNGQKVWTSMAREADWGILLARTNPDAPKHEGISFFMLDMKSPGIEIRPLRELTGEAWFNEVFFNDVFVPADCLVGTEHDGWRVTRTSLANERVFMGSGSTIAGSVRGVLKLLQAIDRDDDPLALAEAGELVTTEHALAVLGFRLTLAALGGADPSGSEASVRKLLGCEHDQHVQEVGLGLLGAGGAADEGDAERWIRQFLFDRNLTIAGGTSEVQRNIIGERLLGLPRDP